MNNPLSLALFVGGALFVTYGVSASDGMSSGMSELFTRTPTAPPIWMAVVGGTAAFIGLAGLLHGARKNFLAANRPVRLCPRLFEVPHDPYGASTRAVREPAARSRVSPLRQPSKFNPTELI